MITCGADVTYWKLKLCDEHAAPYERTGMDLAGLRRVRIFKREELCKGNPSKVV
jgi:hypothetical protein